MTSTPSTAPDLPHLPRTTSAANRDNRDIEPLDASRRRAKAALDALLGGVPEDYLAAYGRSLVGKDNAVYSAWDGERLTHTPVDLRRDPDDG